MTGERLGGNNLSDEIRDRIVECDGLICLLTERPDDRNSNWVRDERAFADANGKRTIALASITSDADGLYTGNERIDVDPDNIADALLKISNTIALWKQQSGRKLIIQLEPSEVADFVSDHLDDIRVEYRLYEGNEVPNWKNAPTRPRGDAMLVYLSGIRTEDTDIELQVRYGDKTYKSRVESQYFRMRLREVER